MRVVKPKVPLETQGRINRMQSDMETAQNDMTVRDNVPKGGLFILHDVLYQAAQALPKGTEAKPGRNCMVKSLSDLGGK